MKTAKALGILMNMRKQMINRVVASPEDRDCNWDIGKINALDEAIVLLAQKRDEEKLRWPKTSTPSLGEKLFGAINELENR